MDSKGLGVCIVWSETRCVGVMEGWRLAMTVLAAYRGFALAAGTRSVYCGKTWRGSSNRTCRIFGDLCNHVEGTMLF